MPDMCSDSLVGNPTGGTIVRADPSSAHAGQNWASGRQAGPIIGLSQVSDYLLQTTQSWANAGVTEDGHCQGDCRPQWFFYVPK